MYANKMVKLPTPLQLSLSVVEHFLPIVEVIGGTAI